MYEDRMFKGQEYRMGVIALEMITVDVSYLNKIRRLELKVVRLARLPGLSTYRFATS